MDEFLDIREDLFLLLQRDSSRLSGQSPSHHQDYCKSFKLVFFENLGPLSKRVVTAISELKLDDTDAFLYSVMWMIMS